MSSIVFYGDCINIECSDYFGKSRDNYNFFYRQLKKYFEENNFEFFTRYNMPSNVSIILMNNFILSNLDILKNCKKHYLLLLESPHVDKGLVDTKHHQYFKKIFTWNDDMVDNQKYFKVNYAFDIPKTIPKQFGGKKLCCTIAGNKSANHPDELYTKRVEFIRWFEKHYPTEFDLYGTGWDQYRFGHSLVGRALNKFKFLRKKDLFPSYKGMVDSKFETMKNYKFSLCYENIKEQNGYITEKIFDSFFAGCVPIYWGSKNVCEHIPKECFIDKREFDSFEEVYKYMKNMDKKTYMGYLDAIEEFLNSKKADPFRAETFADTIVGEIMKDLDK